jgi:hypothetical protein
MRVVRGFHGRGRPAALVLVALALTGCAGRPAADPTPSPRYAPPPPIVWQRVDGRRSPELAVQGNADLATCRAVAMNAGNQVQIPTAVQRVTRIGEVEFQEADWAPTAALMRRQQTQDANFRACMAQRGYRPGAAP